MTPREAAISISGVELTVAQSMTVRVALGAFAMSLEADGLGDDEHGRAMVRGYLARIREIDELIGRTAR